MKPYLIKLKGSSQSLERYTYGQHLQYNGVYAYGGPGTSVPANPGESISLSLKRSLTASDMGTIITYDDARFTYDDQTKRYNGADARQDDGPQLSIMI